MFGEKPIYGQTEVLVDYKSRIMLPKFTKAEKSDKLLLVQSSEGLKVIRESEFDKIIASLQKRYEKENNSEVYMAIERRMTELCSSILKSCTCDAQKRINTGGALNPNQKYLVIGCRDSILIQDPSKQDSEGNKTLHLTPEQG